MTLTTVARARQMDVKAYRRIAITTSRPARLTVPGSIRSRNPEENSAPQD
jgi:hypothetical protein